MFAGSGFGGMGGGFGSLGGFLDGLKDFPISAHVSGKNFSANLGSDPDTRRIEDLIDQLLREQQGIGNPRMLSSTTDPHALRFDSFLSNLPTQFGF